MSTLVETHVTEEMKTYVKENHNENIHPEVLAFKIVISQDIFSRFKTRNIRAIAAAS